MAATQTIKIAATPSGKTRGFNVSCPRCGERTLSLDVDNMDFVRCSATDDCGAEWQLADLADEAANLLAFCEWVAKMAPTYSTE